MNNSLLLFILTLLPLADTLGQSASITNLINCIDLQYGADNLLINGRPYFPSHTKAEGHPYFQTEEWKSGTVYINGNSYPVQHLKYNLFNDQLILKHERPNGTSQQVVLSELLVDSFQMEHHLFVNRSLILPEQATSAYLEKIFAEKLSFYRFQKKVLEPISNSRPYGQFSPPKDVFLLLQDKQKHKITQKKEFLACFPDHKVAIKKYLKSHSLKWKKITKIQFVELLKFCNDQI